MVQFLPKLEKYALSFFFTSFIGSPFVFSEPTTFFFHLKNSLKYFFAQNCAFFSRKQKTFSVLPFFGRKN